MTGLAGGAGARTYTYDFQNRLVAANVDGVATLYDYGVKGRRVGKDVAGTVTRVRRAIDSLDQSLILLTPRWRHGDR